MKTNPPYSPNKKLVLHFICKASFWLFFLVFSFSFGQLYVSDSTFLTLEGEVFINEGIEEEEALIIYIGKGTKIKNFPTEGNFIVIDQSGSQKLESKEVFLTHLQIESEVLVEEVQKVKSKTEGNKFIRIEKKSDRTFSSENGHRLAGIIPISSSSKYKNHVARLSHDFIFYTHLETNKVVNRQKLKKENKGISFLFSPRGPPF